jgi:aminoglycoside phosphotransferase (APT) family kinase protein
VYQILKKTSRGDLAPALLGWRTEGQGSREGFLFVEWLQSERQWPWAELECSSLVLGQLAALHGFDPAPILPLLSRSWDYERDLMESAEATVHAYESAFLAGLRPGGRPMLPALKRLVGNLPQLRRELMTFAGKAFLHGDVHSGNVVLRATKALLLDWARARIGSPLEDVASWIHSLALWEPEAKRKHDTLLERYRIARGEDRVSLTRDFRDACVLAGACNALAGALRYHLEVPADPKRSAKQKANSFRAAADLLRIIHRADACVRN